MPHCEAGDLADLVIKWRTDIVLFVNQQFNVHPTEQQERILVEFVKPSARVAAKSGHGIGKTTVLAWILLWVMTCFDDVKVPCTSPTAHQLVDLLWPEVKKWQKKMLEPWCDDVTVTNDKIKLVGTENYSGRAPEGRTTLKPCRDFTQQTSSSLLTKPPASRISSLPWQKEHLQPKGQEFL